MSFIFKLIRKLILVGLLFFTTALVGILYYIEYELPDINALNTVQLQTPLQVFTSDKKLIAIFGEKRRVPLPYDQIPPILIQAVLATEDQRYFKHKGVDLPGLGRAALQLIVTGKKVEGGSTITMQVARSFYLNRHKTFGRKLREILLAIKIETKLTKEKILELYLNKVFLGNRAYGVEAAAEIYYGKHLKELRLDQYAMLAGLPKAPSFLNPLANATAALKRRNHVLGRMYEQHYINENQLIEARDTPLDASYHDLQNEFKAPYVAELARAQLEQMYGDSIYADGLKVYTTLDSRLQSAATTSVHDNILAYDSRHGYRGILKNLGTPAINRMDDWRTELKKIPSYGGLLPAAVTDMTEKTITVLQQNGDFTLINWEGLAWARKQINPDYLGPLPKRADQIVKLGDVIYIVADIKGDYRLTQLPKVEASLVVLNPNNGAILAMVGGFDFQLSKFNRATSADRQPGSCFKPFVYSAGLEKGLTFASIFNDAPMIVENDDGSIWRPQNDTHKFYGPTRLRDAIIHSRNLVSIRLLSTIGVPYAVDFLKKFGFVSSQLPASLSLALGTALVTPLQMAQAYAVFANGGMKVVPFVIDTIYNAHEDLIYQAKPQIVCAKDCQEKAGIAPRVISAQNAFLIDTALSDVIDRGTAKQAKQLGRTDLAGKTGTTQNQVDAWFAGYSRDLVAISWMGFDQPQSLHEWGAQTALPMWIQFMKNALKDQPEHPFEQPPGILSIRINPLTGQRASATDSMAVFEYFMEPYLPQREPPPLEDEPTPDIAASINHPDQAEDEAVPENELPESEQDTP